MTVNKNFNAITNCSPINQTVRTSSFSNFVQIVQWLTVIADLLSVFGCALILYIIIYKIQRKSPTFFLIANLASTFLIFSCTSLESQVATLLLYDYQYKKPDLIILTVHCCLSRSLLALCYTTSMVLLLITCYERYRAIIYPTKTNLSRKRRRRTFIIAWLVSAIITSPQLFLITVHPFYPYYCELRSDYKLFYSFYYPFLAITCYFIPDLILICCYVRLIVRLNSIVQVVGSLSIPPAGQYEKRKRQVIKMLTATTLASTLLSVLWAIVLFLLGYCEGNVYMTFNSFPHFVVFYTMAQLFYGMTPLANVILWFHYNDELNHQMNQLFQSMVKICTLPTENRVAPVLVQSSLVTRSSNNNDPFTPLHEL
ncbi:Neuropeptide Y receptor type 2 [Trichoplax sp. H2]|nr:Neuropeptide Y receptor type 2 [Trichoplax sp. H2]|eukprot:RDD39878.1 Neuropeptide Y receptor type 2 [Trichoplax sp. H2]